MDKEDVFEMEIRELTENALAQRKENLCEDEQKIYDEVRSLSTQTRDFVKELPQEQQEILTDHFEKTNLIAAHECAFLYVQGAKDCLEFFAKARRSVRRKLFMNGGVSAVAEAFYIENKCLMFTKVI